MLLKYNHDIAILLTMHVTVVKLFINDISACMSSSQNIFGEHVVLSFSTDKEEVGRQVQSTEAAIARCHRSSLT